MEKETTERLEYLENHRNHQRYGMKDVDGHVETQTEGVQRVTDWDTLQETKNAHEYKMEHIEYGEGQNVDTPEETDQGKQYM